MFGEDRGLKAKKANVRLLLTLLVCLFCCGWILSFARNPWQPPANLPLMPVCSPDSSLHRKYRLLNLNTGKIAFTTPELPGGECCFGALDAFQGRLMLFHIPFFDPKKPDSFRRRLCVFAYPSGELLAAEKLPAGVSCCGLTEDGNRLLTYDVNGPDPLPVARGLVLPAFSPRPPVRIWQVEVSRRTP